VPLDPSLSGARTGAKLGHAEAKHVFAFDPDIDVFSSHKSIAAALSDGPASFLELMAALGSKGRPRDRPRARCALRGAAARPARRRPLRTEERQEMIFLLPACGEKVGMRGAFARLRTRHCSLARIARITPP
jgi:hypothetical protein